MNYFDGQIFFALLSALILSWITSGYVARRYAAKVLEFMQAGTTPFDQESRVDSVKKDNINKILRAEEPVQFYRQNRNALWRLRSVIVLVSALIACMIAIVDQAVYVEDHFSWRRLSMLSLVNIWPLVPGIGLLERWSRWKIMLVSFSYLILASIVVMVNSNENQSLITVVLWLIGQQVPLLAFIFFMTGPKLRAVGPYLLVVFFLLTFSSLLGLSALEQTINVGNDTWLIDLVQVTDARFVFFLFSVVPWLLVFYPIRFLARHLALAYRKKVFSEPWYLFAGVWSIALMFQAMMLSHSIGFSAYGILAAWLLIPLSMMPMKRMLRPQHQPPTLLLLRVFRGDDSIESLFDSVMECWRYTGNTVLIAGNDLALRNLEPDELFTFLSGHLRDRFISDEIRLQQAIRDLDLQPDPDGRYRINEFFCFDSTWKSVLSALVDKADIVLMDLRAYNTRREGCSHELKVLASKPHLRKMVVLFNKDTDKQTAANLLSECQIPISWIDSESYGNKLKYTLLEALLSI